MIVRVMSFNDDYKVIVRMTLEKAIKVYNLNSNDVAYILNGGGVCELPYHYKKDYIELDRPTLM